MPHQPGTVLVALVQDLDGHRAVFDPADERSELAHADETVGVIGTRVHDAPDLLRARVHLEGIAVFLHV